MAQTPRQRLGPEDLLGRGIRDLRISVTDRCNLRCTYCMPREVFGADFPFLPQAELLSFGEIARLAGIFASLGVRKLRLTGGEPLLRRQLPKLVALLSATPGIEDIAMTTNGLLLSRQAEALRAAGLKRVTVSLDALNPQVFGRMNGLGLGPEAVLEGIAAAEAVGLPIKINVVVQRGVNEDQIEPLLARFGGRHSLRFIEFMDVGNSNGWNMEAVVPSAELLARLKRLLPLQEIPPAQPGEVATRYRSPDGVEIGLISSVTQPFCGSCNRARLSAAGELYTCLFAAAGQDLRGPLRDGWEDGALRKRIQEIWQGRADRYSELRGEQAGREPKVEMSHIGG